MMINELLHNIMAGSVMAESVSVANLTLVVMGLVIIIRNIIKVIVIRNRCE